MDDLLFLAHRIPYPPNKGDKMRSWHMVKHLAQNWRIHLGAFVDDPTDWQHRPVLEKICADICLRPLDARTGKLRALSGLLTGKALTLPYYQDATLDRWVQDKLQSGIRAVVVFSSAMAQFVIHTQGVVRIMDFVDIDSDKWTQYAPTKAWPLSWIYAREGRKLLEWERQVAQAFDASLFVSPVEARDFCAMAPESAHKISHFNQGVDTDYYSPEHNFENPFPAGTKPVVFTGAMDYWPNVDAVTYFKTDVMPLILAKEPKARFYIVGTRPTPAVQALADDTTLVTGRVPDTRPYVAHAAAVVAPLRIARGIQNKVLEGCAMAKTVVVSPQALEGIAAQAGTEVLLADTPAEQAERVLEAFAGRDCGAAARQRVLAEYTWAPNLAKLDVLLQHPR